MRQFLQSRLSAASPVASGPPLTWDRLRAEIDPYLKDFDRTKLIERVRHFGLYAPELDRLLDRLERFIKDNRL